MRTYVVDDLCESMILVSRCCQSVTALTRVSSDPSSSVPTLHRQFRLFIVSSDSSSSVPDSSSSVPDSSSSVPTLHRQFPTLHRQSRPLIVSSRLFIVSSRLLIVSSRLFIVSSRLFIVSPARLIASAAYSVTSGCWSSTYLMFRYDSLTSTWTLAPGYFRSAHAAADVSVASSSWRPSSAKSRTRNWALVSETFPLTLLSLIHISEPT